MKEKPSLCDSCITECEDKVVKITEDGQELELEAITEECSNYTKGKK